MLFQTTPDYKPVNTSMNTKSTNSTKTHDSRKSSSNYGERYYQDRLILLSAYAPNIKLTQEVSVKNTLESEEKSRRFDLVQLLPNKVRILELKLNPVTSLDVSTTIGDKGYMQLAREKYGKEVELVFTSPRGIDDSALRLIHSIPNARYINMKDLAGAILSDYRDSLIPEANWMLKRVTQEFQDIL